MTYTKEKEGEATLIRVSGSINTQTAEDFRAAIKGAQPTTKLIIDLTGVDYISSAGLRVFLWANGLFPAGSFVVRHPCPEVQEVFTMTGFSSFLTIEK
jgi:anti-sigma B factor antagonist